MKINRLCNAAVTTEFHKERIIALFEHRICIQNRNVPFVVFGDADHFDSLGNIAVNSIRIKIDRRRRVGGNDLFAKRDRIVEIGFSVGTAEIIFIVNESAQFLIHFIARSEPRFSYQKAVVSVGKHNRNISAPVDRAVGKIDHLLDRPFETRLAVFRRPHTDRSVDHRNDFGIENAVFIANDRLRHDECADKQRQHLTDNEKNISQFAGGQTFFTVFQAEFPDVSTGNFLMLVVRFQDVDNDERDNAQKSQ